MDLKKSIKQCFVKKVLKRNLPLSLTENGYALPATVKILDSPQNENIFCNINLDDLCPKYYDEEGLDCGGNIFQGLSVDIRKFLETYPYAAITFFVIPSCISIRNKSSRANNDTRRYDISSSKNQDWLNYYKILSHSYTIEFSVHGCFHYQSENLVFGHHTEFAFKSEDESSVAILTALDIFNNAGLNPKGFRPPGWDMNSDLSLCKVLNNNGFFYIAASSFDGGFNSGKVRVHNYYPTLIDGILNLPQNVELDWSLERIYSEIAQIVEHKGIISIKGHFYDAVGTNSLSSENIKKLYEIFVHLNSKYPNLIKFSTMHDIATQYLQANTI